MSLEAYLTDHPKQVLIFDFDETLFRLHLPWGDYKDETSRILREYDPGFYSLHQEKDWTNYELINAFTREFGLEPREQALEYAEEFEKRALKPATPNETLLEIVKKNTKEYLFFIWSSNCVSTIRPILQQHDLEEIFAGVIGRDSVTYHKPEPDGFVLVEEQLAQQDMKFEKGQFLMIGDSSSDEGAARAAGIEFFRVNHFRPD